MMLDRRQLVASTLSLAASTTLLRPLNAFASTAPAAPPPASLPLNLVHPDLRQIVPQLEPYFARQPKLSLATLAEQRNGINPLRQPPRSDVAWQQKTIPGNKGQPDVSIIVVNARPGTSRPAILHTHGGGFVAGKAAEAVADLANI